MSLKLVEILTLCLNIAYTFRLPSYVEFCKFADPEFDKCALKNAKLFMANIAKGDRSMKIPPLTPFKVPFLSLVENNFHMNLSDINAFNIEKAQINDVKFDKKNLEVAFFVESVLILGDYIVNGQILVVPIQGDGKFNLTAVNGNFTYTTTLDSYDKNGKAYFKLAKDELRYDFDRVYYHFDHLFNGDERLSTHLNTWLNENWKEVLQFIDGSLTTILTTYFRLATTGFLTRLPEKDLFL